MMLSVCLSVRVFDTDILTAFLHVRIAVTVIITVTTTLMRLVQTRSSAIAEIAGIVIR